MKLKLSKISKKHSNLINSEGSLFGVYLDKNSGDLYARGTTNKGQQEVFCKTNSFRISLFLDCRMSLTELFLMSYDEHFIVKTGSQAEAQFIEIENLDTPNLLKDLNMGDILFQLINQDMRPTVSTEAILSDLPETYIDNEQETINDIQIIPAGIDFFKSTYCPINLVSVVSEKLNPYEYDYIEATTHFGEEKIYTKTNPVILRLFFTGRLSFAQLFRCYMRDEFLILNNSGYQRSQLNKKIEASILNLNFANNTYQSLPDEFQTKNVLEMWKSYSSTMINGLGIVPAGFKRSIPVELEIDQF